MKIKWEALVLFLKTSVPGVLKSNVVPLILKTIGVVGGFWAWIVGVVLSFLWTEAEQELESAARIEDQKQVDDSNIEKYQKDIKEGASVESKTKSELDILNGTKP